MENKSCIIFAVLYLSNQKIIIIIMIIKNLLYTTVKWKEKKGFCSYLDFYYF